MFYGDRVKRGIQAGVIAFTSLFLLNSCALPSPVEDRPTAHATSSGRFRSAAQALAEARSTYVAYLRASRVAWSSDGLDMEALEPFGTDDQIQRESMSLKQAAKRGLHLSGKIDLRAFGLQKVNLKSGEVSAYACVDQSHARVRNKKGEDVTPRGRAVQRTNLVAFVYQRGALRLQENGRWSGSSICP